MSAVRELAPRMDVPRRSARALSPEERAAVLALLRQPEFVDQAPQAVFAANLEQQRSFCSVRTMYRLLAQHGEVREWRHHLRHPVYTKPELLAEAPNRVWSWDITKLLGPTKWVVDAQQAGRLLAGRPGSHHDARTATRVERQSVSRGAV
jgi:hypothetical protein